MSDQRTSPSFEQQLKEVESIVEELESGRLSLDDMLARYESGMRLIAECQRQLSEAELRVSEIAMSVERVDVGWDEDAGTDDDE